jgi:SWIM zinc finger
MTQMEAYLKVVEQLPIDDPAVLRRLERADKDILRGYGYTIVQHITLGEDTIYTISKLSTAPMGTSDSQNGSTYTVTPHSCTCPDFESGAARGGLCKHRLAIMIREQMEGN